MTQVEGLSPCEMGEEEGTLNLPVPTLAALIMARKHLWGSGSL